MKALSLLQPWATLVVQGNKTIETRSWSTAYRGELLIHASLGKAGALLAGEPPFSKFLPPFLDLPRGALLGRVILTDVVPIAALSLSSQVVNRLSMEERAFGDYSPGRFAWLMEDAIAFTKPVPVKGGLGVWNYTGPLPGF